MFRQAVESDFPALAELEALWSCEPWSEQGFASFCESAGAHVLLLEEAGELLCYATFRFAAGYGELLNLAVSPAARRRGLGRRLLSAVLECAEKNEVKNLTLEVRASNTAARHLYEACGFSPCGVRRNFYKHPTEDAVVYSHLRKDSSL